MNSRNKGKVGEREFAALLREHGFDARRGQQFSGSPDSPDVVSEALAWLHVEVKRVQNLNLTDACAQASGDAAGKPWIVAHRRNHAPWLITMRAEFFFDLLREFQPVAAPPANAVALRTSPRPSRMLEDTKRVGETADAIELRQAGENSILMTLALSLSDSISQVLRWVYWWNSTEQYPEDVSEDLVLLQINTDFTAKGLTALELTAIVSAWQAGAISQATMFDLFRKGEVLPTGRTDAEEKNLVLDGQPKNQNGQENGPGVEGSKPVTPSAAMIPPATNSQ